MKTIERENHVELHPETDSELNDLRIAYPHLWPFQYVCVHKEFKYQTYWQMLKRSLSGKMPIRSVSAHSDEVPAPQIVLCSTPSGGAGNGT